jgi:MFS family permease
MGSLAELDPARAARPVVLDGPYSWLRLAISVLMSTIGSVGMWSVILVLPQVQEEFGVGRAEASLPYTLTMIGFAFGNLLVGRAVDRVGITRSLVAAGLALGAGYALSSAATALWQFALVQGVLIGVGTSACFGPLIADVSHWFRRHRGFGVAAAASGNYIAGAIWPLFLKDVVATEGWRGAHMTIAVVCVGAMLPLALLLRRRPLHLKDEASGRDAGRGSARTIALSPGALQWLLVVAGLCCCVAMSMPQVHIVAYCADLGYGVAVGAEMLSLMLAGGILSRLASGVLADRIGGVPTLLLGSVLQCAALLLYIPFDGLTSLYVVSLVFGLSQGGIVPSYAIVVREYLPAREAGQRVGLVIMATVFGMALGGWMSGWIYDATRSYQAAFVNGIAFNLLNVLVMALVWSKANRRMEARA